MSTASTVAPDVMFDLVIRGAEVVGSTGTARRDVGIRDGTIQALAEPGQTITGSRELDATGRLLLPGLVDAHVHIPGHFLSSRLDNFDTATRAAAAGGVTTVMLMPTDDPRTATPEYFERKRRAGEQESYVDFAIQAMLSPRSERCDIQRMAEMGAVSFELFLAYGGAPEFVIGNDDYELRRVIQMVADVAGMVGVTPHSVTLIQRTTADEKGFERNRRVLYATERQVVPPIVQAFASTRPVLSEALGVTRACTVAADVGARVHFRGLSAAVSVEHALRFADVARVTTEVMSHHVVFTEEEAHAFGPYGIIVPPIRSRAERDRLREALRLHRLDMVVSDHSPVLPEDKERGWEDIWRTLPGMPGLQTLLGSMLWLVDEGALTLHDVVRLCAEKPAAAFGLHPRKGTIAVGADADLIVLDPARRTRIDDRSQLSRASYTTMKGREHRGYIERVFLRGEELALEGQVLAGPRGRFVRP